jgi:cell wall-associated NlpC family hydrolase
MTPRAYIPWARYVGVPFRARGRGFDGADCYGLVALLYREEFGLDLDDLSANYWADGTTPASRVGVFRSAPAHGWVEIAPEEVEPGDVLSFRVGEHEAHCGVAVDRRRMLHVLEGLNAVIEAWNGPTWGPRFVQAYRRAERMLP